MLVNSNLNHTNEELGLSPSMNQESLPAEQDSIDEEVNPSVQPQENQNGENISSDDEEYREQVFNSLTDEQKNAVYYIIGQILDDEGKSKGGNL